MVNYVIQILWKIIWQCWVFLQCHTAHNATGDCLRTPLFPTISALFHGFFKTQFFIDTGLSVCLLLLIYIQVSYTYSSILSFLYRLFYPFWRGLSSFLLIKGPVFGNFFLLLLLQVFQDFWSYKFFILYQIQPCLYFIFLLPVTENTFNFSMFYCWNTVFSHFC